MENQSVWVFNQYAGSPKHSSGAGERHFFLAKKYKTKKNIDTVIFSASYNHLFIENPSIKGISELEEIDGVKFCWIKVPKYRAESSLGRLISWFAFCFFLLLAPKGKLPKPSTIIVSSMSIFPILNALFYKLRNRKVQVIFEVRDIWPMTPIELGGHSPKHPLMRLMAVIEKWAYNYSDKVVSVLPNLKEHVQNVVSKPVDVHWIPNGIEPDMFQESDQQQVQRVVEQFPKGKFIVGYTGAIGTANVLSYLVEAARIVKQESSEITFVIIGEGPEKAKLQQLAKNYHLDNIYFFPKVRKHLIIDILKQVDIGYIACQAKHIYHYGISPNKYNDYMLAKKPILNSGNLVKDTIFEAKNGKIVASENAEAIAKGILELYQLDPQERQAMGERGYEYLWAHRTYDRLADQYLELIK